VRDKAAALYPVLTVVIVLAVIIWVAIKIMRS
jgi:hypothetical protein